MMQKRGISMASSHPYEDVRKLSETLRSIFDYLIKSEDMIHDRDKYASESLEHYQTMYVLVNKFKGRG